MRKYSRMFLMMTVITGLISFTGLDFKGIGIARILFVIFADLFLVSVMAKVLFPNKKKLHYQKIDK